MVKNMTGYVYVTLLLLVLIALGFVLSGGIILSDDSASTIEGTDRYTIADTGTLPSNPTLQLSTLDFVPQVCGGGGYDIALVIDVSGSITNAGPYLSQMKSAITSFVETFSGKSTKFSVTKFSDTAEILISEFTGDLDIVKGKIVSLGGGGYTNWQDALVKAKETLDSPSNRPSNPDLVVFASDGVPNTIGSGNNTTRYGDGDKEAVDPAIIAANEIKSKAGGVRIIAFGIGGGIVTQNLQKISGSTPGVDGVLDTDVISTNFNTLGTDLAKLTVGICGP